MPVKCMKIRLKPGSEKLVQAWAEEVRKHQQEALEALKEEGVTLEYAFLDNSGNQPHLIYVMKSDDFKKSQEVTHQSTRHIDAYHKAFQAACWEDGKRLETILELEL